MRSICLLQKAPDLFADPAVLVIMDIMGTIQLDHFRILCSIGIRAGSVCQFSYGGIAGDKQQHRDLRDCSCPDGPCVVADVLQLIDRGPVAEVLIQQGMNDLDFFPCKRSMLHAIQLIQQGKKPYDAGFGIEAAHGTEAQLHALFSSHDLSINMVLCFMKS